MLLEILVGPMGAGKSTYASSLPNATVISQDKMGRKGHIKTFNKAIAERKEYIVIDRINHKKEQRKRYIKPALEAGYTVVFKVFKMSYEECFNRVINRDNHPTIPKNNEEIANRALTMFFNEIEWPSDDEI